MAQLNEAHRLARIVQKRVERGMARQWVRMRNARSNWAENRGMAEYEANLMGALRQLRPPTTLFQLLVQIAPRHRPMRIWDDGAGQGTALATLSNKLKKEKIRTFTLATTLENHPLLDSYKYYRWIDETVIGASNAFVPRQAQDAIFSVFGTVNYNRPQARKEHLRKLAHCLTRNGALFVVFRFSPNPTMDKNKGIEYSMANLPRKRTSRALSMENELDGIKKAFEKQGFECVYSTKTTIQKKEPNIVTLIIRRKN